MVSPTVCFYLREAVAYLRRLLHVEHLVIRAVKCFLRLEHLYVDFLATSAQSTLSQHFFPLKPHLHVQRTLSAGQPGLYATAQASCPA